MLILDAMLPVFALIAAGFALGRLRRSGPDGLSLLNGFTLWLALPALLFQSLAGGVGPVLGQPGFLLAFGAGVVVTLLAGLAAAPAGHGGSLADRALFALAGSYANTAFIGIPVAEGLFGAAGLAAAVAASLLTVSLLFAVAVLLVEIGLAGSGGGVRTAAKVARRVLGNPLVASPLAGMLWSLTGWPLPSPAARFLSLLAAAASPCALVAIGAFLSLRRPGAGVAATGVGRAVGLKLVVQPAVTAVVVWGLLPALGMPLAPAWAASAVLIAALPTGTGPFMLAELHGREAGLASRAILLSTVASMASVTVLAWVLS